MNTKIVTTKEAKDEARDETRDEAEAKTQIIYRSEKKRQQRKEVRSYTRKIYEKFNVHEILTDSQRNSFNDLCVDVWDYDNIKNTFTKRFEKALKVAVDTGDIESSCPMKHKVCSFTMMKIVELAKEAAIFLDIPLKDFFEEETITIEDLLTNGHELDDDFRYFLWKLRR